MTFWLRSHFKAYQLQNKSKTKTSRLLAYEYFPAFNRAWRTGCMLVNLMFWLIIALPLFDMIGLFGQSADFDF